MTFDEIKTAMETQGYRYRPESGADNVVGRFHRKIDSDKRDAGSQVVYFEVVLFDRISYDRGASLMGVDNRYGFEVNLRFEAVSDLWVNLSAYSVRPDQFLTNRTKYENLLRHYFESL